MSGRNIETKGEQRGNGEGHVPGYLQLQGKGLVVPPLNLLLNGLQVHTHTCYMERDERGEKTKAVRTYIHKLLPPYIQFLLCSPGLLFNELRFILQRLLCLECLLNLLCDCNVQEG